MEIMRKNLKGLGLFVLVGVLMLQGCGSKSETASYDMAVSSPESGMIEETTEESDQLYVTKAEEKPLENREDAELTESDLNYRKLIKTVDMTVETEEFDALMANIKAKVTELGGYFENISNNSNRQGINRYSSMTLRIPVLKLDQFVTNIQENSNVLYSNEYVQDVTLSYVDLESHKKALLAEQDTLLRLLEKAETIEDIIQIESRLSDVRYQIESMESQLRTYDNLISYSTVYISLSEVERETVLSKDDPLTEMKTGFTNSFYKIIDGFKNFGIDFVINLPYIILYVVILGGGFFVGFLLYRKTKKKNNKVIDAIQKESKKERSEDEPKL